MKRVSYQATEGEVFGPCQERSCLHIPTTSGNFEVELDEIFYVNLRVAPGQDSRIRISPIVIHKL